MALMACLLPTEHAKAGDFAFSLPREDGSGWLEPGRIGESPTVFIFWRSDCPLCLMELAELNTLRSAFPTAKFVLVAFDTREAARRTYHRFNIPADIEKARAPRDPRRLLARLGNKQGALPFSAVYDARGTLCVATSGRLTMAILKKILARCPNMSPHKI